MRITFIAIPNDYTKYILSGEFYTCCQEHAELNDTTMCRLNKDVNNRIYTLIRHNRFN